MGEEYCVKGRMEVAVGEGRRSVEILLSGAPTYSEADLHIATGFYLGAGRLLGCDHVHHGFTFTDQGARVDLRW